MIRQRAWLGLAALVAVTACGPQPATVDASPETRIANATAASTQDGTARIAMTMKGTGGSVDFDVRSEGALDFDGQRMAMTMNLGEVMGQDAGSLELISEGSLVYVKLPQGQQMGVPTPWVSMDLEKMGANPAFSQLQQFNNDPSNSLQLLRGLDGEVLEVGSDEVRGVATTHYRAVMNVRKALAEAPRRARRYLREEFERVGIEQLPVDVWLDEQDRVRRQSFSIDTSKAQQLPPGAPTTMEVVVEMFDFGADVTIEPPPPSDVTDVSRLPGAGG